MTETLYDYVKQHEDIVGAVLVWNWSRERIIRVQITENITYEHSCSYYYADPEYTFIGDRQELLEFCSPGQYDCWDDLIDDPEIFKILHGILLASYGESYSSDCSPIMEYSIETDVMELNPEFGELIFSDKTHTEKKTSLLNIWGNPMKEGGQ